MPKRLRFNQFVYLEKGPVNTAIIDVLKGGVYHVDNLTISKFLNHEINEIRPIIHSFEKEGLVVDIEETRWIAKDYLVLSDEWKYKAIDLEVEEGANLELILKKLDQFEIINIVVYVKKNITKKHKNKKVKYKKKNFRDCVEKCTVNGKFEKVTEDFYFFNKSFNSCWGKKIFVTNEGDIKPCPHSSICIGNINKGKIKSFEKKFVKYWSITKDSIRKCKNCEFRYICFDCRVMSIKHDNDMFGSNPNCNYNPISGKWLQK